LGDKWYPLIFQITTSFKEKRQHIIFKLLYNTNMKQNSWSWSLVENAFGILKTIFSWELLTKTNLNVSMVLEVFITCCMLHNWLLFQTKSNIQKLMQVIDLEVQINPKLNVHGTHKHWCYGWANIPINWRAKDI
jgi:hypothetical protein